MLSEWYQIPFNSENLHFTTNIYKIYRLFSKISRSVKRNAEGRYYTVGKQYSIETYATIFKVVIKYKEVTGQFPLPTHLSKMTCVSFKVTKKAIMYMKGGIDSLHKPSDHSYSSAGFIKPTMADQLCL